MYGCESWSLTKNGENKINIFEIKILRKTYGPTNDNGDWRIRYNQELYNEPDIIKMVKSARLRWLGHLYRTEELNPCKKLTSIKPIIYYLLFTGAYSPGRTFGLPFLGFPITHTDTR
jgi:hypothetical protein